MKTKLTILCGLLLCGSGCADRRMGMRPDGAWAMGNTKYTQSQGEGSVKIKGASANAKGSQDPDEAAIVATGQAVSLPIDAVGRILAPYALRVGTLKPGAAPTPIPDNLQPIRDQLRANGQDIVPAPLIGPVP